MLDGKGHVLWCVDLEKGSDIEDEKWTVVLMYERLTSLDPDGQRTPRPHVAQSFVPAVLVLCATTRLRVRDPNQIDEGT
jgi:hypothetical protein